MLLILWAPVSILLLFALSYVGLLGLEYLFFDTYTDNLDMNFWVTALVVTCSYTIAFASVPFIILSRHRALRPSQYRTCIATAAGVLGLLMVLRLLQDTISRIDCGDNCTNEVIPVIPGAILTGVVFASLLLSLAILSRQLSKKVHANS